MSASVRLPRCSGKPRRRWLRFTLRRVIALVSVAALTSTVAVTIAIRRGTFIETSRFIRPDDGLVVVDRHGSALRHVRDGGADRRWVALHDISPNLVHAVLAAEDAHFFDHGGADLRATLRAAARVVMPWRARSGASTITQQLVKLVYGRPHGVWSKALELLRALSLERRFDKNEILEQYLNRLPFGDGIEGVARASEAYFGVPVSDLSVSQAALLAGIPQAPSVTEPRRHLGRALARRGYVLARMRDARFIDEATHRLALSEVPVVRNAIPHPFEAPRFVDASLVALRSRELAQRRGVLETSLDLGVQRATEEIVRGAVARFESRGVSNGAAVVVRNVTGEMLAYVGAARSGSAAPGGEIDLLQAPRQPGSTLKPFAYELLFERGATAATILDDVATPMLGAHGELYEARDFDGDERGPVRARVALASSLNLAALDVVRRVGVDRYGSRLRALDLDAGGAVASQHGVAAVLGSVAVSALRLARAYATLARRGTSVSLSFAPRGVQAGIRVMDERSARLTTDILSDAPARVDAFGASLEDLAPGIRFALKTGTSAGFRDAWSAVFTDAFTVVVWLGDPAGAPHAGVSGFDAAAPAAVRVLAAAYAHATGLAEIRTAPRVEPAPFESAAVCTLSGQRPSSRCRHVVVERFVPGSAPRVTCTLHDAHGRDLTPPRLRAWAERTHRMVARDSGDDPTGSAAPVISIVAPHNGARLLVEPSRSDPRIELRAQVARQRADGVRWEIDGAMIRGAVWSARAGTHTLVAVWRGRRSLASVVTVVQ